LLTIQNEGVYRANHGQSQAAKYKELKHPISRFKITDDRAGITQLTKKCSEMEIQCLIEGG
jgi:hypothetical protein